MAAAGNGRRRACWVGQGRASCSYLAQKGFARANSGRCGRGGGCCCCRHPGGKQAARGGWVIPAGAGPGRLQSLIDCFRSPIWGWRRPAPAGDAGARRPAFRPTAACSPVHGLATSSTARTASRQPLSLRGADMAGDQIGARPVLAAHSRQLQPGWSERGRCLEGTARRSARFMQGVEQPR